MTNLVKVHSGYLNGPTVTERVIAETWIAKFRSSALCVSEQVYRGSTREILNCRYGSPTVFEQVIAETWIVKDW